MLHKQLVLLWESASWVDIERLVKLGKLPNFQRFCSDGTAGRLTSVEPVNPVTGAVSLATGLAPCDHEILGNLALTSDRLRIKQRQSADWKPIWDQLKQAQQRCICVNWPVTHPSLSSENAILSDRYSQFGRYAYRFCTPADSVSKGVGSDLTTLLNQARIQPDEITDEVLSEFFHCEPTDFKDKSIAFQLRYLVAQIYTTHAASLLLVEHQEWDCAWINYSGLSEILEILQHKTLTAHHRDCVYQIFDQLLGVICSKLESDVMIHIVSTHSLISETPDISQGVGIWAIRGGSVRKNRVIHGAHVLDIAPTILGLRAASYSGCEHSPRKDLFTDFPDEVGLESTSDEAADIRQPAPARAQFHPHEDLLKDGRDSKLFNAEDRFSTELLSKTGRYALEGKFQSLLQMQRFEEAEEIASGMLEKYPDSGVAQINYSYCLYAGKKYKELDQHLSSLSLVQFPDTIIIEMKILHSRLELALGRKQKAITLADELRAQTKISPNQLLKLAGVYRDLGESQQALGLYETLINRDSEWLAPKVMLATALLKAHRYNQAEIAALAVLKIDFTHERMQYTLAMARLRQGNKALAQAGINEFIKKTGGTRLIDRILTWIQPS